MGTKMASRLEQVISLGQTDPLTRECSCRTTFTVLAYTTGTTDESMMGSGIKTECTEKASFFGPMAACMRVLMKMTRNVATANLCGLTAGLTKASGKMVNSMAKVYLPTQRARPKMGSGNLVNA